MNENSAARGRSYKDPLYDDIEASLEKRYGLPKGLMRNVRTKGERSNADQVSEAGARSVYQVIPATRDAFLKRYGVDAYAGPEKAAEVAALHLRDSYRRTHDWTGAVAEYHGGTDRRNHGARTRAYVGNVTGQRITAENIPEVQSLDSLDILNTRPDSFEWARRPLGPAPSTHQSPEAKRLRELTSIVGAQGIPAAQPVDNTPILSAEAAEERAGYQGEQRRRELENVGLFSRIATAVEEEWLGAEIARSTDRGIPEYAPGYFERYLAKRAEIEDGHTPREVEQLRATWNEDDLAWVKKDIERSRNNRDLIDATGHGTAFSLLAGFTDPVGWLAGAGVGKGFQVAGVGSRVLATTGRTTAAVISLAAEGAVGNVTFTAMLDAAGRTTTSEDYWLSAGPPRPA